MPRLTEKEKAALKKAAKARLLAQLLMTQDPQFKMDLAMGYQQAYRNAEQRYRQRNQKEGQTHAAS